MHAPFFIASRARVRASRSLSQTLSRGEHVGAQPSIPSSPDKFETGTVELFGCRA